MLPLLVVMHCQFLTKDQSSAQGQNNLGCQSSGLHIPSPGPSAQEASPQRLPLHLRSRLPGEGGGRVPHPSASLRVTHTWMAAERDPEPPKYHWDAENNLRCTFRWKCSRLICIRSQCFFYKPVTACDASITNIASGNMDKAESLPKIKTCQSRSK